MHADIYAGVLSASTLVTWYELKSTDWDLLQDYTDWTVTVKGYHKNSSQGKEAGGLEAVISSEK